MHGNFILLLDQLIAITPDLFPSDSSTDLLSPWKPDWWYGIQVHRHYNSHGIQQRRLQNSLWFLVSLFSVQI